MLAGFKSVRRPASCRNKWPASSEYAHKPITNDHPSSDVTADNWRNTSVGWTGEAVTRDGDCIRVPMMIADAAAIHALDGGKRELSCGYTCDLDWTPGKTPSGESYDARQVGIRINHVAIVAAGRAGSQCRVGDSAGAFLRDAAGQPVTLHDERTGGTLKLNADLITAIENEAAKLNMSVHEYVQHVLKYSFASANLSGNGNTGSPAKKETI